MNIKLFTLKDWEDANLPPIEYLKTNTKFDQFVGGLVRGSATVISGFSGNGKSLIGLHLASAISKNNKVGYVSCENLANIDLDRFKKVDKKSENIVYYNVNHGSLDNVTFNDDDIISVITQMIKRDIFDVIFVDGLEVLMQQTSDGAGMYAQGNELMKKLIKAVSATKTALVITYQLNRASASKKLEDINAGDIADSLGIIRYATNVYALKRDSKEWRLRCIKSRVECDWSNDIISVVDLNGNVNLLWENPFL